MALSPYKGQQITPSRARSSSCSTPIRNQIVYQEIYTLGENTLFRSYSCNQVFKQEGTEQTIQATQILVSNFITPDKKFNSTYVKPKRKIQTEPKKLELNSSKPEMVAARKRLKMSETVSKTENKVIKKTLIYFLLTVISSCLFYLYTTHKECSNVWDLEKTINELKVNVLGQDDSITTINSVLQICNSTNEIFTMVFTGGVGVGKTFTSSIISRNFPWSSNKLITYSETIEADMEKLLKTGLKSCGHNLVVIDDLTEKSSKKALEILNLFYNKRQNNVKLLVILIFRTHSEVERSTIVKDFKDASVNFYHVPFKNLSRETVKKCFEKEIYRQGIEIPEKELDQLVDDKMVPISIVRGTVGCKGVVDEVSFYYKKFFY